MLTLCFSFSKSQLINEKPGEKQLAPTNGKIATQAKEEEEKKEKKDKEEESWEVVKPKMSDNKIETNGIVKKIQ